MRGCSNGPVLIVVVGVLMTSGCGVTFRFGPGPTRPARMSTLDRCVFEHRLVLRPASASYTGKLVVADKTAASPVGQGYTVYQGARRIDATRALKRLGDPGLEASYLGLWKKEKKRARVALHAGGGLLGGVMLFGLSGGLVFGLKDAGTAKSDTRRGVGLGLLAVAVAALLAAPILLGYGYHYARITESFRTLFIVTPTQLTRLRRAVAGYEAKVKAACRKRVLGAL